MNKMKFKTGDVVQRNGSTNARMNTLTIIQVHVTESGKLIRYVGWHKVAECPVVILARHESYWSIIPDC